VWWCTPVILALWRQRQEDGEFKPSQGYIVRICLGAGGLAESFHCLMPFILSDKKSVVIQLCVPMKDMCQFSECFQYFIFIISFEQFEYDLWYLVIYFACSFLKVCQILESIKFSFYLIREIIINFFAPSFFFSVL
jgi:hypothetical protein